MARGKLPQLFPARPRGGRRHLGGVAGGALLAALGLSDAAVAAPVGAGAPAGDAAAEARQAEERRVALVIGIQNYEHLTPLDNPIRDAAETARTLRRAGFEVVSAIDPSKEDLEAALRTFFRSLDGHDVGLLYYSGHAVQIADRNYVLPADAALASPYDLELQAIAVDTILSTMRGLSRVHLLFLDACRENPFPADSFKIARREVEAKERAGLAAPKPVVGSFIAYSTTPGDVAYDGAGTLSPFTEAFVQRALDPRLEVRQLMARVRADVLEATRGRQVPWDTSTLVRDFFFVPPPPEPVVAPLHHVDVPAAAAERPLAVPRPTQVAGGEVRVELTAMPAFGEVVLDGRPVRPGERVKGADVSRLVFRPRDAAPGTVGVLKYEAIDDWDNRATGIVTIGVKPGSAETGLAEAEVAVRAAHEESRSLREAALSLDGRVLAVPVGVGPVPLSRLADLPGAGTGSTGRLVVGGSARGSGAGGAFLAIGEVPEGLALVHRGRTLTEGARVPAGDIGAIAVRPAVGAEGTRHTVRAVFEAPVEVAAADGAAVPGAAVSFTVEPVLDPCDVEAAQPFDLQGVAPGRLPNEIDPAAARGACRAALEAFPDVARFRFQLGRAAFAANRLEEARDHFEAALAAGHVRAGQLLGLMARMGAGQPADAQAAVAYYEAAAARGDPYAQHSLGVALVKGIGTEPDVERGLELLGRAVEVGHTYALNELGYYHFTGDHVGERDVERARRFFQQSAGREDIYGFHNMGFLYLEGAGVERDVARAIDWFRRAHAGGHPTAGVDIGLLYEYGRGVPRDTAEALGWYRASAARGAAWGAFNAANLILSGARASAPLEAPRLLALSAARGGGRGPTDRALAALAALDQRTKTRLLQSQLNALGYGAGPVDGIAGPATRRALAAFEADAGGPAGGLEATLAALAKAVWERDNPRYDLF